jgi:hypothetical protein
LKPTQRFGRDVTLNTPLTASTFACAVSRGSDARPGNDWYTAGLAIAGLIVHGISASSCVICVKATVPLIVVCAGSLYIPTALTEFSALLGAIDMRPRAGPLPLL